MIFPTLQSAEDYLRSRLQDFYNQRGVLAGRLTAIEKLKQAALKVNDQQTLGQLVLLRQGVLTLLTEQLNLEDRLKPYADYFGVTVWRPVQSSLGLFPLVLAAGALAVAAALYLHFEKLKNQAKALDMVARGIMSAEKADEILNPSFFSGLGGSFSMVGIAIAGVVGLLFFATARR